MLQGNDTIGKPFRRRPGREGGGDGPEDLTLLQFCRHEGYNLGTNLERAKGRGPRLRMAGNLKGRLDRTGPLQHHMAGVLLALAALFF